MPINEAAALGAAIKTAAMATGSILVEATVQARDDGNAPTVIVSSEDAVRIIRALSPQVIYLVEQAFDLAGEIETTREELNDIGGEPSPDRLAATQRQFASYDGQVGAAIASFMVNGILHTAVSTAAWNDEFGDAVETILEGARQGAEANQFSKHSAEAKAIERKAVVLAKHSSFNHGRVSFDKRMTLAETLFQNCDQRELSEITRRAENLFWLEQSGVKLDNP
jgi:(p)ppGpp synthase/HD superfamily hydrolase